VPSSMRSSAEHLERHSIVGPPARRLLRHRLTALAALCSLTAACAGASSTQDATTTEPQATDPSSSDLPTTANVDTLPATIADSTDPAVTEAPSEPPASADVGTVVALGEEFVLADLLAIGVVPVASTATVPSVGLQGLDAFDTSGIDLLPSTELNLELLASYQPDVIVATRFVIDQIGVETLGQLGDVVAIDDDATATEQLEALAARFDRTEIAQPLVVDLNDARQRLAEEVAAAAEPCTISVATIYPGPSVAVWVTADTDIPATLIDAGCEITPGPDAGDPDRNGRLFVSFEQLGLLDAPRLVLLQSSAVDGEAEAAEELGSQPLWQAVPAVAAGQVTTLDRLAYPGVVGQLQLVADLNEALTQRSSPAD